MIPYGTRVHVAVRLVANCYIPLLYLLTYYTKEYETGSVKIWKKSPENIRRYTDIFSVLDGLASTNLLSTTLNEKIKQFLAYGVCPSVSFQSVFPTRLTSGLESLYAYGSLIILACLELKGQGLGLEVGLNIMVIFIHHNNGSSKKRI